ncbi:MAG: hypothetical protein RLZZ149_516, partial [Pseudomonadota bacterium]
LPRLLYAIGDREADTAFARDGSRALSWDAIDWRSIESSALRAG